MVVREPTEDHVLLPPSQVLEIWSSSIQVTVTKHIWYAMWHGKGFVIQGKAT
jgi:hypothetical protein